jgi:hypothetical protein
MQADAGPVAVGRGRHFVREVAAARIPPNIEAVDPQTCPLHTGSNALDEIASTLDWSTSHVRAAGGTDEGEAVAWAKSRRLVMSALATASSSVRTRPIIDDGASRLIE